MLMLPRARGSVCIMYHSSAPASGPAVRAVARQALLALCSWV